MDDARSAWILFGDLLQVFLLAEEAQELSEALMPLSDTCMLLAEILLEAVELPVMAGRPSGSPARTSPRAYEVGRPARCSQIPSNSRTRSSGV